MKTAEKKTALQGLVALVALIALAQEVVQNPELFFKTLLALWLMVGVAFAIFGLVLHFKKTPSPKQPLPTPTIDGHYINE